MKIAIDPLLLFSLQVLLKFILLLFRFLAQECNNCKTWPNNVLYLPQSMSKCHFSDGHILLKSEMKMLYEEKIATIVTPSCSSYLDQVWHILFSNILLKKEKISWSEENFHFCKIHLDYWISLKVTDSIYRWFSLIQYWVFLNYLFIVNSHYTWQYKLSEI